MMLETIDEQTSFRSLPWEGEHGRKFRIVGAGSNAYATALEDRIRLLTSEKETATREAAMALDERQSRIDELTRRLANVNNNFSAMMTTHAEELAAARKEADNRVAEVESRWKSIDLVAELAMSRDEVKRLKDEHAALLTRFRAAMRNVGRQALELAEGGRKANEQTQRELAEIETMARKAGI